MAKPAEFVVYPKAMRLPYGPYMASVSRVIDGDTVVCLVDAGLDVYPCIVVRLARINAPEMGSEGGQEAKDYLIEQVFPSMLEPAPVQLKPLQKDPYGRYVGEITLADGRNLSDVMAESGHAEYHSY